jgi:imidazolonepropionase-like amidohydrolase
VLIVNATIHLGNGEKIEEGAIGFREGKIDFVASALGFDRKLYETVIEAKGQHVYPGFIAPNSTLGLTEIDAVRATLDYAETGVYNPSTRTLIAFNTESEIIPTVRANGVLLCQPTPRGGLVAGTSSVVQLDAWNWEDAVIRSDVGIHVYWPQTHSRGHRHGGSGPAKADDYDRTVNDLKEYFKSAKAYAAVKKHDLTDTNFEAMRGLFDGSLTLFVHADGMHAIASAINLKKELSIRNMILVGGYEADFAADLLKDNNVGVMIQRVHSLPARTDDPVNHPFLLPGILHQRNVKFCFENSGDMEAMGARNLPFMAGTAVAHGLPYEAAVAALTLNAAKFLGIDKSYGSLEKGKSATLFLSEGDALDMRGNKLTRAWIDGRSVDLDNRQEQLYRKYKAKYE